MQNHKSRMAIIHLAKKQLGLDEIAYRAILSGAGFASAKDIETDSQFNMIMTAFQNLGFHSARHTRVNKHHASVPGANPAMISCRQEYYIKGLWALASRAKDEKSLRRMVKRIGKVDDISFLSRQDASAVILALRDICWKVGFNPDSKEGTYAVEGKRSGAHAAHEKPSGVLPPDDGANLRNKGRQGLADTAERGSGF